MDGGEKEDVIKSSWLLKKGTYGCLKRYFVLKRKWLTVRNGSGEDGSIVWSGEVKSIQNVRVTELANKPKWFAFQFECVGRIKTQASMDERERDEWMFLLQRPLWSVDNHQFFGDQFRMEVFVLLCMHFRDEWDGGEFPVNMLPFEVIENVIRERGKMEWDYE
eukprot:TRINITY_DN2169_c0_g1_i3.p1 TRINITY_DN2169_c0_g1~~TRINITY_DN2169_c0_g1_i3.p1  ORF type:complete len:163 (-),score=31.28 TRINITY_DN2169_c0_g1_i3:21-509(-)